MIIAFAGRANSGKSTACKMLVAKGYTEINFADPLKVMVTQLTCVPLEWLYDQEQKAMVRDIEVSSFALQALLHDKGIYNLKLDQDLYRFRTLRMFLQFVGDLFKEHDPDYWINLTLNRLDPNKDYVLGDCRYATEADAIRRFGGTVVLIARPGTTNTDIHSSEQIQLTTDYQVTNTDIKLFKRDILAIEGLIANGKRAKQKQ
jgi:hypothetical protein